MPTMSPRSPDLWPVSHRSAAGALINLATCAAFVLLGVSWTQAQAPAPPTAPVAETDTLTPEQVQTRRQEAEQAADLDSELKQKVLQAYDQATSLLDEAARSAARAAAFEQSIETAPSMKEEVARELEELSNTKPAAPPDNLSLEELKAARIEKENALGKAEEEAAAIEAEIARRVTGRQEIPKQIADAQARLAKVEEQLRVPFAPDTPESLARAQTASLRAEKQSLEQTIAAYEKELVAYGATAELLPLQQKLATARVTRLEEEVAAWRQAESRMTEIEAKRKAYEARLDALRADPELQDLATGNQTLAELAEALATRTREVVASQVEIKEEYDRVDKQFKRAEERVKAVGLTNAIGQLLRTWRAGLPDLKRYYRDVEARQSRVRDVQMKLFELEDQRADARTLDEQVADAVREIGTVARDASPEELEAAVRDLLIKRDEYLTVAINNHYDYLRALGDTEVLEWQLIHKTEAFADYIDERVLWIQSAQTLGLKEFRLAAGIARKGVCPDGWSGWLAVGNAWADDAADYPALYFVVAALVLSWFVIRRRVQKSLVQLGQNAATSAQMRIWPTIQALLATALVASVMPAMLFWLGLRLAGYQDVTEFVGAVGTGMIYAAQWWLPLALFWQLCRPKGLAESHFDWPAGGLRALRRHLRWFTALGTPLVFLMTCVEAQGIEHWQNSLGRFAFLGLMVLSAVFFHVVLRSSGATFRNFQARKATGLILRSRHVLHWLAVIGALLLALTAFFGYYYTAFRLGDRARETVLLVLALAVASALLSRWILVVRRRLAIEQMRQRRAAEQRDSTEGEAPVIANLPTAPVEQETDLTKVSEQTRRFVNSLLCVVGVLMTWWIWIEVLPALAFLDRVPLWHTVETVTETVETGETTSVRSVERPGFISLAELGMAAIILFVTVIAAKNLPGLLEISLPQRLALDAGARYAITTLTRYVVIAIGMSLAFSAIGFTWSKVQWLVAALGVGLGFGLQEIFANFISGLIILFERPIRVGDIVSVEGVTGVVSRIQTRATTVTNWDRQDFIVPNKEFITGRLLNWTRSDQINRIVINVGVAYGSDTEQARQLIERLLGEHPEVLEDPAPLVTFEGFGDSTLNLVVRCYLAKLDNRLRTIHELHTAIDQAFREANIEIAFPQRDIHIRSGGAALAQQNAAEKQAP